MSLQFIVGPSGAGKSNYIYDKIIKESIENPDINYILLVPEQYSMVLQRKMVMLHPYGGTMNIDVIGFNRLSYRIFDEQNVNPSSVLEDFGKTMLVRQVAGEHIDELEIYSSCIDKPGFIDEIKSLMSEMYQYDISRDKLRQIIAGLENSNEETDKMLLTKLKDMLVIFEAFEQKIADCDSIVAEQLTELLAKHITNSKLIKNSVVVFDGFTGFTPIQYKVVSKLLLCAGKNYMTITMDDKAYRKCIVNNKALANHELFYLSYTTMRDMKSVAKMSNICIDEDIFINPQNGINRWSFGSKEIEHLEKNIFRFPYEQYNKEVNTIKLDVYDDPRRQIEGVADKINQLVIDKNIRYKDIAVICGNLEENVGYAEQIFPAYHIPYFVDYTMPLKDNACIDAIGFVLKLAQDGFSYDSVFTLLKSGVFDELDYKQIEKLENFVLARGLKGFSVWSKEWNDECNETRELFIAKIEEVYRGLTKKNACVLDYVESLRQYVCSMDYKNRLDERIYETLMGVFDKLADIMGTEVISLEDFAVIYELGIKDINMGNIPSKLDMVLIGDITRTRLDSVKALFIIGVNDGVIPKKGNSSQIINDYDKERMEELGFSFAPTDKINSYIEQFYLYQNMTKPSNYLYLSYTKMNSNSEPMRPSYIIGRVRSVFTCIKEEYYNNIQVFPTKESGIKMLVSGIRNILDEGDLSSLNETVCMYKAYEQLGTNDILEEIKNAAAYVNVPGNLSDDIKSLLRLRLMSQSISKLEKFANCQYSYFLQYTLGLKERDVKMIDNRDIGNILHSALESMYRHVYDNMENNWSNISENEKDNLIERFVIEAYDKEYEGQMIDEGRYKYLKNVLIRIGKRSVKMLSAINENDCMIPEYFEYSFEKNMKMSDENTMLKIRGVVDRGDIYYNKSENKLYLRIIDYKTGEKDFDFAKLYDGLQLQLAVYMNIMLELAKKEYSGRGIDVLPKGMYYYRMQDPMISISGKQDVEEQRKKTLVLKGLDSEETEVFDNVMKYSDYKVKSIVNDITKGNINKNPITSGNQNACTYCSYKEVCRFDSINGGNSYRYLRFNNKEKAYEEIKKIVGGDSLNE